MRQIGDRVVAIKSATKDKALIYGKGIYVGDFIPEEAAGWMAEMMREIKQKNPKIILDDGNVVYGCECWWGPEEKLNQYPSFEVCSIVEERKVYQNASE